MIDGSEVLRKPSRRRAAGEHKSYSAVQTRGGTWNILNYVSHLLWQLYRLKAVTICAGKGLNLKS
jgi:hypothetical protein